MAPAPLVQLEKYLVKEDPATRVLQTNTLMKILKISLSRLVNIVHWVQLEDKATNVFLVPQDIFIAMEENVIDVALILYAQ